MKLAIILALTVLFSAAAYAAPPPVGSEDWEIMQDFGDWIRTQSTTDGMWCCDAGDGRPVESRLVNDGWQVRFRAGQFDDHAPVGVWIDVPDAKVLRDPATGRPVVNPLGVAIVWWFADDDRRHGAIRCFAQPGGV